MSKERFLTKAGLKKLKEELRSLKEVGRSEVAAKIKEARDMGDVLENSIYDSALEEQGHIEGRIKEIEDTLSTAVIIDESKTPKDVVGVGSVVVVEFEDKKDTFTIVGSAEADPVKKLISNESPVGKALLGSKIGDIVEVVTPIFTAKYKIVGIK